ncbi:MAG: hypothetical protein M1814_002010 [Vezdaea aestivalis]|nr:MAG: hypothetical protein M1814_002010 [Vezdaea aestivalis]
MYLFIYLLLSLLSVCAKCHLGQDGAAYDPSPLAGGVFPRQANEILFNNGTSRSVYLVETIYVSGPTVYSPTYDRLVLAVHCALEFSPLNGDGAFRVEVIAPAQGQFAIRGLDVGSFDAYTPPFGFLNGYIDQEVALLGNVSTTNDQLLNPQTGEGIINSAWGNDRSYRIDGHNSIDLTQAIAQQIGLPIPNDFLTTFQEAKKYTQGRGLSTTYDSIALNHVLFQAAGRSNPVGKEFSLGPGLAVTPAGSLKYPIERLVSCPSDTDPTTPYNSQRIVGHPDDPNAACGGASQLYPSNQSALPARDLPKDDPCKVKPNATIAKLRFGGATKDVAAARIAGKLSLVTQLVEDVVRFSGIAALIANPTIIILDLINGQFRSAAFAAVGLVIGIAIDLIVSGPIGWVLAAAVTAFFAILPGLFKKVHEPPSNNIAKIVQWSFFGDATHTGNEKCNQNLTKNGLPPNCTAVYGPGVIASVLKWEMVDAVAFMIEKNQGHAMSIIDIAGGLFPIDHSKSDNGTGAAATVDCGAYYKQTKRSIFGRSLEWLLPRQFAQIYHDRPRSKTPSPLSEGYDCDKPIYRVNRAKITIPVLNLNVDQIYGRIIGPKGGDCKLLSDAAEPLNLDGYGIRLTGRPAAIACNITAPDSIQNGAVAAPLNIPSPTATGPAATASASSGSTTSPSITSSTSSSTAAPSGTSTGPQGVPSSGATITLNVTGGYNFLSCNTDSVDNRVIGPAQTFQDTITPSNCSSICKGSAYFGLEFGYQCFCGDFIATGSNTTDANECRMPCRGNATEACGGTNRILIYEYSSSPYVSPSNTTSDGSIGRARVQAPQPPTGFATLTAADTMCLNFPGGGRCFPPGKYDTQRGSLGFTMSDAKDLAGPLGWNVQVPYTVIRTQRYSSRITARKFFAANQTNNKDFQDTIKESINIKDSVQFEVNTTALETVVAVCLFTKADFKGDTICLGKGSGPLDAAYKDKAVSITVHGGAHAWIYAQSYDDLGGQKIDGDVADLKNVAYGTNDNMSGKVKALWIDDSRPGKVKS